MPGDRRVDGGEPRLKVWGRRPYASKEGRELLNDVTRWIARTRPDGVEVPADPSLDDCLRHAADALPPPGNDGGFDPKATTLSSLMAHGLTYREAVMWYWFRYAGYDLNEIHYAASGIATGGDPQQRRNSVRNILSTLQAAAEKLPDADPDQVPGLADDRRRLDRDGISDMDQDPDTNTNTNTDTDT